MPVPETLIRAAAYEVSCYPETHPHAHMFSVRVEHQGADLWAVIDASQILNRHGRWDNNTPPDERPTGWISNHWFPLQRALDLAARAAKEQAAGDPSVSGSIGYRDVRSGGAQ